MSHFYIYPFRCQICSHRFKAFRLFRRYVKHSVDRRQFERVANKNHTGGFYTNLLFELEPAAMDALDLAFKEQEEVFRVQITLAPEVAKTATD